MQYAFDLDGTLVDTKDALRQAYTEAGQVPPEDFFGKPFKSWFIGTYQEGQELQARKREIYARLVEETAVKPLPLLKLYHELADSDASDTIILTGASAEAALMICDRFDIDARLGETLFTGMSVQEKALYIDKQHNYGIMFEDNPEAAKYLRENTRWTVCCTC